MIHRRFLAGFIALLTMGQFAWAQQVETDPQTGRQFQVTRQLGKQLVTTQGVENRPYTVYSDRATTEYQPTYRNVYTPVTEYTWEPYLSNRWNPFTQPTVAYHYVPHTRWDMRTDEQQIPVTRHEIVPEQRTAQVPVTKQEWVDVEHITRVAVAGQPGGDPFNGTATAARPIGGMALQQDPPRQGSTFGPK